MAREAEEATKDKRRRQSRLEALWLVACGAAMASSGFRREFFASIQRTWAPSDAIGELITQIEADSRDGVKAKICSIFGIGNVQNESSLQAVTQAIIFEALEEEVAKMKARVGFETKSPREFLQRLLTEARKLASAIPEGDKLVAGPIPDLIEGPVEPTK